MGRISSLYIIFLLFGLSSCITQFIPETDENTEMLVVEGLITDQPEVYRIKLTRSLPLGERNQSVNLHGCTVWVTDDIGKVSYFREDIDGTYVSSPSEFIGRIGRKYKLHVNTNDSFINHYTYESYPMEMFPVPPIDTIFYQKRNLEPAQGSSIVPEGCQVYIETHDPDNLCRFFRWDYQETWEIRIPFSRPVNKTCWVSEKSDDINLKSTSGLSENLISKYPLKLITTVTDRLKYKYSMMVNQYSLNSDEFEYWDKLKAVTQDVGSLYDITPASIPNNIYCIENPAQKVLGYFSVSAKKSKRLFIHDNFRGVANMYATCIHDTIFENNPVIPNLNISVWILESNQGPSASPPFVAITYDKGCADCTLRGTIVKPDFWK